MPGAGIRCSWHTILRDSRCFSSSCLRNSDASKRYSETLKLPSTTFPLRPKHPVVTNSGREKALYEWQKSRDDATGEYILHDGPPYANGDLHMGHALNKILKDIIVRQNILKGKRVTWVLGWDCHGLPIELKALQKHRQKDDCQESVDSGDKKSSSSIRTVARDLALDTIRVQADQFKMMAICGDIDSPYQTLDLSFEIAQLRVFASMVDKGLIYRADKPVYWSPSSRTALAEAELEYRDDHVSHSAYVAYQLTREAAASLDLPNDFNDIRLLIWTTTPWTLPANKAIAVNPDLEYSVLQFENRPHLYIIAKDLVENIARLLEAEDEITVLRSIPGRRLVDLTYHDIFHHTTTKAVVPAGYVSAESGTGLVHTAPGHGQEDYLLCRSLREPILPFSPLDDAGNYTAAVGIDALNGLNVQNDGSKMVLELIERSGHLIAIKKYKHKYPYDWRTKKPVIVRSTPQLFADLGPIRQTALQALDSVSMIPSSGKSRLQSFIRGRDEWCISRQRSWGVPIPALYNESGDVLMNQQSISHVISVLQQRGMDSWFEDDTHEASWKDWLPQEYQTGVKWVRGRETLDVWFDSGCSWTTLQSSRQTIADLYLEGTDQHRGWFQSSLLTSIATRGVAPYKQVITHGFVLDQKGRKMSKSIGNVIDPLLLITGRPASSVQPTPPELTDRRERKAFEKTAKEQAAEVKALGVDTLRLWVAQSDFTSDVTVSPAILSHVSESLRKFRTTLRFMLGNLATFPESHPESPITEYSAIDNYALATSRRFRTQAESKFETSYEFNKVVSMLNQHTNSFLSAFYFDTLKDRLYADHPSSPSRRAAQLTLIQLLRDYLLILAPICPELVDETWQHLPPQLRRSYLNIYESDWQKNAAQFTPEDDSLIADWSETMRVKDMVNKALDSARLEKRISASLQARITLRLPARIKLRVPDAELTNFLIVSRVEVVRDTEVAEVQVRVDKASGEKCPRCWNLTADEPESLCARCRDVLAM